MLLSIRKPKEVVSKSMHIKWDVPKGLVHRFETVYRSFFSGIKMYTFRNSQKGEHFYETLWLSQNKHEGAASGSRYYRDHSILRTESVGTGEDIYRSADWKRF